MRADRQLLIRDRDEIAFHGLQHSYLLLQAGNLALLHAELPAGYQALLPVAGTGWWPLPVGEPYIWVNLCLKGVPVTTGPSAPLWRPVS